MPVTQAAVNASLSGPNALVVVYNTDADPPSPKDVVTVVIPLEALKKAPVSAWKPLALPARLGVELRYITSQEASIADGGALAVFKIKTGRNLILEVLTTDCDPASDAFGRAGHAVDGAVIFRYAWEESKLSQQVMKKPLSPPTVM